MTITDAANSIVPPKTTLLEQLNHLHTTELGVERIKNNLSLQVDDVVDWCKQQIQLPNCQITRQGKNYYAETEQAIITVNAHSYTIITAHPPKHQKAKKSIS
ncbi:hypothetical protein BAU15_06590 [Enterococcus sp. JM4C]|uniref:DUF3781 domain-containing protein n=1 Tax=Candidatus Enterococcus huntleyi TaxID=1857217 RepID=UPI001379961D|nr:DUF3781 domain-containing protein [Enterococcus sp. JM4C]KAF1297211.1 hypothetical protein BAU15_06590 [Enterococcus sp. JM4C]